jgi:hypothetical protein
MLPFISSVAMASLSLMFEIMYLQYRLYACVGFRENSI